MLVETEKIGLIPAEKEESKRISGLLGEAYGWECAKIERFSEKTASSNVFRCVLASGERIVVKESFWYQDIAGADSAGSLEKAYEASEYLRKKGVNLPLVYKTKSDGLVWEGNGAKVTVLEFLEGSHFSSEDWEFSASGEALAGFHRAGAVILEERPDEYNSISRSIPVEKPYEESRAMYFEGLRSKLISGHSCGFPEVCESVSANIEYIDEVISYVDSSGVNNESRKRGIIHNDFGTNNTLAVPDGKRAYFLDMDQMGVGPFVWDIGNTLASYASNFLSKNKDEKFESKAGLFLKAYQRIFPLPLDEYVLILAATQRWDVMRILRTMRRHHYENDRLPNLIPKVSERFIPRIKKMPEIFSFFTKEWFATII